MGSGGFTYMMTNREFGVLYVGVTADIHARIVQHREGRGSEFCRKYGLDRLVLVEPHATIQEAIAREKQLKRWRREWKVELIESANPLWEDLAAYL
ncbi:GIY-YIG nuclease family protein [Novosphingobium sp. ZW T3_23]|uniref:GIY-YIG nuclease family protein n=1 Tax=Novosphingobium sp. ZW T3_23 TaxID=3378084 RepID=UPI0038550E29